MLRAVSVAIPARNEVETLGDSLDAVLGQQGGTRFALTVHVLANNCDDGTPELVRARLGADAALRLHEVTLPPERAHAGWARRLALESAAADLSRPYDVLLCTDADTVVAGDWLQRTLRHLDCGYDAVAGQPHVRLRSWRELNPAQRRRWATLRRYKILLAYLRSEGRLDAVDPWPRHEFDGGASLAMTFSAYRRIAPLPTPPVGEDRAIVRRIRETGGRIRHALDVKVYTSPRFLGRAAGGMAETLQRWLLQPDGAALHETWPLSVELGLQPRTAAALLSFDQLPAEVLKAQTLARSRRSRGALKLSA